MPTIIDQAIVVRLWDFSETSQTVSLFTKEHGTLRGLAKGSRRDKGPFCGGLDLLTRGEIIAIVKPTTDLAIFTEWDLQEVYRGPRRDLRANRAGLYMADLVHHSLTPHDPHPALFDALALALLNLDAAAGAIRSVLAFQWAILNETGYRPRLDLPSGPEESRPKTYGFEAASGGLVADPGPQTGPADKANIWRVRSDTIECLRSLDSSPGTAPAPRFGPGEPDEVAERAARLLAAYLTRLHSQAVPSHDALFG